MTRTVQSPRQSSAYLLALSRLDEIIAEQRLTLSAGAAGGGEVRATHAAPAAEVQTLPDGNHGETFEVTSK